jgi:hypothetical protein
VSFKLIIVIVPIFEFKTAAFRAANDVDQTKVIVLTNINVR